MEGRRTTLCGYRVQLRGSRSPQFPVFERRPELSPCAPGRPRDQEPHKGPRHKALEENNSAGTSLSLQVSQKPVPVLWLAGDTPIGLAEVQARLEPPFTAQDDRSASCECQSWVTVPPQAKIPQWPLSNHQVFPRLIA